MSAPTVHERISPGIGSLVSGLHPTINDVTTSSHVKYRLHALTARSRASLDKYINNQWRTAPRNAPESQINIAHANLFAIFCKAAWQRTGAVHQAWVCPYCASRERQDRRWRIEGRCTKRPYPDGIKLVTLMCPLHTERPFNMTKLYLMWPPRIPLTMSPSHGKCNHWSLLKSERLQRHWTVYNCATWVECIMLGQMTLLGCLEKPSLFLLLASPQYNPKFALL